MNWFDHAVSALSEGQGKYKLRLRKTRGKVTQAAFIQWVLRNFVKPTPAGLAVADLWDRLDAPPAEWEAARQAACDERDAANEGDRSFAAYEIDRAMALNRRPDLSPEKNSAVTGSKDADPAAVEVFKMAHACAWSGVAAVMASEAAFSASFPDRPECTRGVIQAAALSWEAGPARDEAYRFMAEKLAGAPL